MTRSERPRLAPCPLHNYGVGMGAAGGHRVFVDSNVYFSRTQRDWLGLLYLHGDSPLFSVHWSEDVLAEVVYHLRKSHPTWPGRRISAIRDRLTEVFETGRVADFPTTDGRDVRDPHDAHVHAAALACRADILLTNNTSDFLARDDYDVLSPDEFFVLIDDSAPHAVHAATRGQASYWGRRDSDPDIPARLRAAQCPDFAERVLAHLKAMALEG